MKKQGIKKTSLFERPFKTKKRMVFFFDTFSPSRDIQFFLLCKLGIDDVTSCEVYGS